MTSAIFHELLYHFPARFNLRGPAFLVRAPGRLNIIGEHTDYNGLPVLPFAIDRTVWIAGAATAAPEVAVWSSTQIGGDDVERFPLAPRIPPSPSGHWLNYIKAAAQLGMDYAHEQDIPLDSLSGVSMAVGSDLPMNAGLSSSSALVVAASLAFFHAQGWALPPDEMARRCAEAEHYTGTRGGGMDQAASLCGRAGHALKMYFHPLEMTAVPIHLDVDFLAAHSGIEAPKSAAVRYQYNQRVFECRLIVEWMNARGLKEGWLEAPIENLGELRRMGLQIQNVKRWKQLVLGSIPDEALTLDQIRTVIGDRADALLAEGFPGLRDHLPGRLPLRRRAEFLFEEWRRVEAAALCLPDNGVEELGRILYDAHDGLSRLYEVSHPRVDELIALAREFGLPGARLTGAGFGGMTLHLVPRGRTGEYMEFLTERFYRRHYGRDAAASTMTHILTPSDGASVQDQL